MSCPRLASNPDDAGKKYVLFSLCSAGTKVYFFALQVGWGSELTLVNHHLTMTTGVHGDFRCTCLYFGHNQQTNTSCMVKKCSLSQSSMMSTALEQPGWALPRELRHMCSNCLLEPHEADLSQCALLLPLYNMMYYMYIKLVAEAK